MAGKQGTQASMLDDAPTTGKDAPKVPSQPEVEALSVPTKDGWCAFGTGQIDLPVNDFSIRVVSCTPDKLYGEDKETVDPHYGKHWYFCRVQLVQNSNVDSVILTANMHWEQSYGQLPTRGQSRQAPALALAADPEVEGSGLAESVTIHMRPKQGWYLMLDGIDPAYGKDYGENAPQVYVKKSAR